MSLRIEPMVGEHWPRVVEIIAAGRGMGTVSLDADLPTWDEWDAAHLAAHRFVASDAGEVVGCAALAGVSTRSVYAGVAEVTVYVHPQRHSHGIGTRLLAAVVASAESAGIWTIEARVVRDNVASLGLARRCGFRVVGVRERFGRTSDGRWWDVVLLERRSPHVD